MLNCLNFQDLEDNDQFSDEEFEKFQKEYHETHGVSIQSTYSQRILSCAARSSH